MTKEDNFIKQLEVYLDLEFSEYDKGRLLGYLQEYVDDLPNGEIQPVKIVTQTQVVYRYINLNDKRVKDKEVIIYPKPQAVIDIVVFKSGVSLEYLMGKRRDGDILVARHIAMYLMRKECDITWRQIGEYFNRDHTTAIHAFSHVEDMLQSENKKYTSLLNQTLQDIPQPIKQTA